MSIQHQVYSGILFKTDLTIRQTMKVFFQNTRHGNKVKVGHIKKKKSPWSPIGLISSLHQHLLSLT